MRMGFMESDRVTCWLELLVGYIWIITWLPLSYCLWSRFNCFKNRRYILESLCCIFLNFSAPQ